MQNTSNPIQIFTNWVHTKVLKRKVKVTDILELETNGTTSIQIVTNETQTQTQKPSYFRLIKNKLIQIIDPNSRFYYNWLIIFLLCYLYNLIFLIARTVFWQLQQIEYEFVWLLIDYGICDLIYLLDIFIKFRTGFMKNGELCVQAKEIQALYLRSINFKIDLISIIPTDLFYFLLPINYKRFLPALRLNRLFKFNRYKEVLSISETQTSFPNLFRLMTLAVNILLLIHWNACIYFLLSFIIGFGYDNWVFPRIINNSDLANLTISEISNTFQTQLLATQYIYCFWWSTQTLTTIAEVQPPVQYYQEIYMSFLLMLGVIVLAIVIGSTRTMFANANLQRDELQGKCDRVKEFLKKHKIDDTFGKRIQTYFDYLWMSPTLDQADSTLEYLPNKLSDDIAMNIHIETLKRVNIFQDCEPNVLRELVSKLKLKLFSPGDYVCRKGDIGREMFFIRMGKLEVVSEDGKQVFVTLNAGASFGEISILDIPGNKNGNKRTANIRSVGFSDLFQLTKDDLWAVLSEYPLAKQALLEKGKSLLRKDNLIDEELAEKIEQKNQPLYVQVEYLQKQCMKLTTELDEAFKTYSEFLSQTKYRLTKLENKYKNKPLTFL